MSWLSSPNRQKMRWVRQLKDSNFEPVVISKGNKGLLNWRQYTSS